MSNWLSQFAAKKYLSLESYKKSGEPVRTPVWFVENDGVLYVRTSKDTGKYKRIRNSPSVKVAPCDMRGAVKGEWQTADAKLALEDEANRAYRLLEQKYGMMYKMTRVVLGSRDYVVIGIRVANSN